MSLKNISENKNNRHEQNEKEIGSNEILSNVEPLTHHEIKNSKILLFQIIASTASALFYITAGISLSLSSILLNEMLHSDPVIYENYYWQWIGTTLLFSVPLGGIIGAFLIDSIGRLNTIKLSLVPAVIGWVTIVVPRSVTVIIVGQVITGLAIAWSTYPAMVYITEIARPDIRGSLLSIGPVFTELGFLVTSSVKSIISSGAMAGISAFCYVTAFVLVSFIPESPAWSIDKGQNEQAKKALLWFTKSTSLAELRFQNLIEEKNNKQLSTGFFARVKVFFKPTGYKPLLILLGLFVFQQVSSFYVVINFTWMIFEDTNIYQESFWIIYSALQFAASIPNIFLLKFCGRRNLIIYGSITGAAGMAAYALYRHFWTQDATFVPRMSYLILFLFLAVSNVSLKLVPRTMIAELFPIEIRGAAYSIVYSVADLLTLVPFLFSYFENIDQMRTCLVWFFVVMSLLGSIYTYIFLPETHGVELSDIQKYFEHEWVYIKWVKAKKRERREERQNEEIAMNNL